MSGDDITISKRTDRNGTSYDLEHEGRHVRVRFRDSGELRVTIFGQPVRLDGYRHGTGELYTNIDLVPIE
jgi:hypothetical protein